MKLFLVCKRCAGSLELADRAENLGNYKVSFKRVQYLDYWFSQHWHGVPNGDDFMIMDESEIQPAARSMPNR